MTRKSNHQLSCRVGVACVLALLLTKVQAEQPVEIPVISQAKVFARFDDKLPAVVNYFTQANEAQVLAFYQQHYGDAIHQERKRGRLTVQYQYQQQKIRVVISRQNNLTQVDLLLTQP